MTGAQFIDNGNKSVLPHGIPAVLRSARADLFRRLGGYLHQHPEDLAAFRFHDRINGCGIIPVAATVQLIRSESGSCIAGVKTCKDRWCPVCSATIEAREALETRDSLLLLHHGGQLEGVRLYFLTVTMAHSREDDQRQNWRALEAATSKVLGSKWWKARTAGHLLKFELEGSMGFPGGLHPHAHVLVALRPASNPSEAARGFQARFLAELERQGFSCAWGGPEDRTWWKPVEDAKNLPFYLAKKSRWGIVEELTCSQAKNGGFWKRPIEDLVLCRDLTEGMRLLRPAGIFRTARAQVRDLQRQLPKPALDPAGIVPVQAASWTAMGSAARERLQALVDDPAEHPAFIRFAVDLLHRMPPEKALEILGAIQPLSALAS